MYENGGQRAEKVTEVKTYNCTQEYWQFITAVTPRIAALVGTLPESITLTTEHVGESSRIVHMRFSLKDHYIDLLLSPSCPLALFEFSDQGMNSTRIVRNFEKDVINFEVQLIVGFLTVKDTLVDYLDLDRATDKQIGLGERSGLTTKLDFILVKILRSHIGFKEVFLKRFQLGEIIYLFLYNTREKISALFTYKIKQRDNFRVLLLGILYKPIIRKLTQFHGIFESISGLLT